MKRILFTICIFIIASLSVFANGGAESAESDVYTIALIAPQTGDNAQYGNAYVTGLTVLCNEVNSSGGINGKELAFEVFDDASDAAQSTNIAQMVTSDSKYIAAIGSYTSTSALAMAPLFDEAGMPLLVPNAGNSMISENYTYTFQRGMTIPVESALMARYAVEQMGGEKVAFIALNNDAGLQFMEYAQAEIDRLNASGIDCETVAAETFNEDEVRDYSAICLKIMDADPDIIVVNMGYVECAAILTQAKQVGLTDVQWLGNQSMYTTDFTNLVGDAGIGFNVSTGFYVNNPDPDIQDFVKECVEVGGIIPNAYQRNAYDCGQMIVECLRNGASTRSELYDALLSIGYFKTKTGAVTWSDRQVEEQYLIIQYQGNGEWKMLAENN